MRASSAKEIFSISVNQGGRYTFEDRYVTIKDYLKFTSKDNEDEESNHLKGYSNNRAGNPLNKCHVRKIANSLYVPALGIVPIAKDSSTGVWTIYDAHNRTDSLHERSNNKVMTKEELESLILLRIIPYKYALEMYVNLNNVEKHTNMNKLLNSDLPAGKFVTDIVEKANMTKMNSNWKKQVLWEVCAISNNDRNADYKKVSYVYSRSAQDLLNFSPTSKKDLIKDWTSSDEEHLIFALKKTSALYSELFNQMSERKTIDDITKGMNKLLKSARFFGIILNYATSVKSEKMKLFKNLEQFAANIITNVNELNEITSSFTTEVDKKMIAVENVFKSNITTKARGSKLTAGFKIRDNQTNLTTQ